MPDPKRTRKVRAVTDSKVAVFDAFTGFFQPHTTDFRNQGAWIYQERKMMPNRKTNRFLDLRS